MTSDRNLFSSDDRMREASRAACDALLIALQREHPEIVRHLQDQSAANRKAS